MTTVVQVAVPLALPTVLDYAWAGDGPPVLYSFVEVEVGRQTAHGLVVALPADSPHTKLKPARPVAAPPLAPDTAEFYRWVARYTLSGPGEGLRAALPGGQVPEPKAPRRVLAVGAPVQKPTAARQKVLGTVAAHSFDTQAAAAAAAGVGTSVVAGLLEQGALVWQPVADEAAVFAPVDVALSPAQERAARTIGAAVAARTFRPYLLDGVTGSGKTEVYFDAIAHLLNGQGQALVLVPEIALTPQWLDRFRRRFGADPVVWHSAISDGARRAGWWAVHSGTARVVIGARSALFLPFRDLRLVVVDEEHDPSYKQDDNFRYQGRDMAVVRARLAKCPVVLASATPSLESWHNAAQGRYERLDLPQRHAGAALPAVHRVDLTKANLPPDRFIAPAILEAIKVAVAKGEQALLFLNRRGYAPLMLCRTCGHRMDCPSCDASLVVHGGRLECHHCGFTEPTPDVCPKCNATNLHAFGPGTRKVLAELEQALPGVRATVADRDSVRHDGDMADVVTAMEGDQLDVLIGTQMVAKGHHFPKLTVVGVLDADMGLAHGDLRAAERTFQLLTQVAGRAGRAERPGVVYLQTHTPQHPLFDALTTFDRDRFYALELQARREAGFPPFGRLVALLVSGANGGAVEQAAHALARQAPQGKGVQMFGPAPAPLSRLKDRFRWRLLLRTDDPSHALVKSWVEATPLPPGVRLDVDVDPYVFS